MLQRFFIITSLVVTSIACGPTLTSGSKLEETILASDLTRFDIHDQKMFLSGVNLAWNNYARDFGDFSPEINGYDHNYFDSAFSTISQAGANTVRLWLHTSGEFNPKHDQNGFYVCQDPKLFNDMADVLDLAQKHNLLILLSLWSFDMLDNSKNPNMFGDSILQRNKSLLTDQRYLDAYINNCYNQILDTVKDKPAMFAIEVLNEPEGMTPLKDWSNTAKVPMSDVQRFIGKIAAVTHHRAPRIKVTSAALSADFLGYYTDGALVAASGEAQGTLDFYEIHYYDAGSNPFTTAARLFSAQKPLIIGEFASNYSDLTEIYQSILGQGYAGALAWKYKATPGDNHGSWADGKIAAALNALASSHADAIAPRWSIHQGAASPQTGGGAGGVTTGGTTIPPCTRPDTDPDHDGWGWENNASCRMPTSASGL